jgi:cytochrome c biogenesis protein CcmG/thiol:disulfide interchange protein DsbE
MKNVKVFLLLAVFVGGGALVFFLGRAFGTDPHAVPFMLEGKPAPHFALKRMDTGETVSLEHLKGHPVVLNFWASWCGPCAAEQPILDWGAQALGTQAQFLGVVFEDTEANAKAFFDGPTRYPQLVDPLSHVAVDYAVSGVPETYFIDSTGVIQGKVAGPIDQGTLVARVEALVKRSSGAPVPGPSPSAPPSLGTEARP